LIPFFERQFVGLVGPLGIVVVVKKKKMMKRLFLFLFFFKKRVLKFLNLVILKKLKMNLG
jgi:hypothetical protein